MARLPPEIELLLGDMKQQTYLANSGTPAINYGVKVKLLSRFFSYSF